MKLRFILSTCFAVIFGSLSSHSLANGEIGDHVNELDKHIGQYVEEVNWLIEQMEDMVDTYAVKGAKAAKSERVMDFWEEVDFHSAIEVNFVPVYASIWQGLFAVKTAIDEEAPVKQVEHELEVLETTFWQALGAVRLAAKLQKDGLLKAVETTENEPVTPAETLADIQNRLDRVVAKHAEQLKEVAKNLVFDTYLHRFEGVEGTLIEHDADLVEDLEKDFNVTLPKALDAGASVDKVRAIVDEMNAKLDTAKSLIEEAEKRRKNVF